MSQPRPRTFAALTSPVDWSLVRRVLLIRLRSIGDTVLMTPCLTALRDWRPDIEIGVVIEPLAREVLAGHPLVDHLFVADKSVSSRLWLITRLRKERFDVAFNLHGGSTGMLLAAMSGAQYTVGFQDQRGSSLLNQRAPSPEIILGSALIHSVEQQLALLHYAGVPLPNRPALTLQASADLSATLREKLERAGFSAASLKPGRFAIVAPGAAFESKRWSARGFASVIDHMTRRWQLESIVVAGPGQEQLAKEVAECCSFGAHVLSRMTLSELKSLVGNVARVFVGNDSGPMHIAAALGCPLVAVFGSSNPDVWHPWTEAPYRVLGGERGVPDNDKRGSIEAISAGEVIAAVDEVLQSAAARAHSSQL